MRSPVCFWLAQKNPHPEGHDHLWLATCGLCRLEGGRNEMASQPFTHLSSLPNPIIWGALGRHSCRLAQPPSSSGQDARFSFLKQEFDSPRGCQPSLFELRLGKPPTQLGQSVANLVGFFFSPSHTHTQRLSHEGGNPVDHRSITTYQIE